MQITLKSGDLLARRAALRMSQTELAVACNAALSSVQRWEKRDVIQARHLRSLEALERKQRGAPSVARQEERTRQQQDRAARDAEWTRMQADLDAARARQRAQEAAEHATQLESQRRITEAWQAYDKAAGNDGPPSAHAPDEWPPEWPPTWPSAQ